MQVDKKFIQNRFDIVVPPYWVKEDLLDLRAFLETQEIGETEVFIFVK